MARLIRTMTMALLVALAVAGCDKCGNRVLFVAPSVQHACGDNASAR